MAAGLIPTVLDVFTNFVKQRTLAGEAVKAGKFGGFLQSRFGRLSESLRQGRLQFAAW